MTSLWLNGIIVKAADPGVLTTHCPGRVADIVSGFGGMGSPQQRQSKGVKRPTNSGRGILDASYMPSQDCCPRPPQTHPAMRADEISLAMSTLSSTRCQTRRSAPASQ
jgi:hypothetical protein